MLTFGALLLSAAGTLFGVVPPLMDQGPASPGS
jgi:hypothetical protein